MRVLVASEACPTGFLDDAAVAGQRVGDGVPDALDLTKTGDCVRSREAESKQHLQQQPTETGVTHETWTLLAKALQEGGEGGYRLAAPPDETSVADIVRAVEGPLGEVRGEPPESLDYPDDAQILRALWVATRASVRTVLEHVSLADLAKGRLPETMDELIHAAGAWERRSRHR